MRRIICLLVLLGADVAMAQEESLVGKIIVAKEYGVKITQIDEDGKSKVVGELSDSLNYRVLEQKGNQVKVRTGSGVEGWFDKSYALSPTQAVDHFTKQIDKNRNDAVAYQRRSYAREMQGDYDGALRDINDTIHLTYHHMAGWNSRGILYCARKEYDKAITDFGLAIRFGPPSASPFMYRGYAWMMKKQYARAVDDLTSAIYMEPKQPYAYTFRGLASFLAKDYAKAHSDFNRAQKLDPDYPHVYAYRARLYATSADKDARDGVRAMELAKQALRLAKDPEPILFETLAAAYAEAGHFGEAIRSQERALADPRMKDDKQGKHQLELYQKQLPFREE